MWVGSRAKREKITTVYLTSYITLQILIVQFTNMDAGFRHPRLAVFIHSFIHYVGGFATGP